MEITLGILLIPYAIGILFFLIFAFFNVYHLVRFGFMSFSAFLATFIFLAASVLLLWFSWQYVATVNWQEAMLLGEVAPPI